MYAPDVGGGGECFPFCPSATPPPMAIASPTAATPRNPPRILILLPIMPLVYPDKGHPLIPPKTVILSGVRLAS